MSAVNVQFSFDTYFYFTTFEIALLLKAMVVFLVSNEEIERGDNESPIDLMDYERVGNRAQ